jgi:hypothetical protein
LPSSLILTCTTLEISWLENLTNNMQFIGLKPCLALQMNGQISLTRSILFCKFIYA